MAVRSNTVFNRYVTAADLSRFGDVSDMDWLYGDHRATDPILRGRSGYLLLRDGLSIHYSDAEDLCDLTVETETEANLGLRIFLEGAVQADIGGVRIPVPKKAEDGERWQPIASLFAQSRTARFVRHPAKGVHLRKVVISMTPQWLETGCLAEARDMAVIRKFASCHLAQKTWVPSAHAIAMTEQILNPPVESGVLEQLYIESRVLSLIAEGFQQLLHKDDILVSHQLRSQDRARLQQVENLLLHRGGHLTAEAIAAEIGVSTNTLQRLFHNAHGTSVSEYVRSWRLERARRALEHDGVNIADAAYLAGYSSPANFATAFKRQFGMSPSEAQISI